MGRRATKKVATNGETMLHQRYLYRGYLQIAACDLTSEGTPNLWHILWDPTQPIATRPLAIQKDGTWHTYGWDLTKNICELFKSDGTLATSYTYSPYGAVTAEGDVEQPIRWSSEFYDDITDLIYYNYRYYNTYAGRWISRDKLSENYSQNTYIYSTNPFIIDALGLGKVKVIAYIVKRVGQAGLKKSKALFTPREIMQALEHKKDIYFVEGSKSAKQAVKGVRGKKNIMHHGYNDVNPGQYPHYHPDRGLGHAHAFYGNAKKSIIIVGAGSTTTSSAQETQSEPCYYVSIEELVSDIPDTPLDEYTFTHYNDSLTNQILDFFNLFADINDLIELFTPEPVTLGYKVVASNPNNQIIAKLYLDANLSPDADKTSLGIGSLPIMNCVSEENPNATYGEIYDETLNIILNQVIGGASY